MIFKKIYNLFHLGDERQKKVLDQINTMAQPDLDYFVLTIFAGIIISLGLILDNSAVIIGGMLMAPLVWPILSLSLAMTRGSLRTLEKSIFTLAKSTILILLAAFLIGLISPFNEFGIELFSRTQPTIIELLIALASGFVAAFVIGYPGLDSFISGVVIASAIVPPLCVTGLSLAEKDLSSAAGSFLLFTSNLIAMILSAVLFFALAKFKPLTSEASQERRKNNFVWSAIFLIIITIPLITITSDVLKDNARVETVKEVILSKVKDGEISKVNLVSRDNILYIDVQIRGQRNLTPSQMEEITDLITQELGSSINLKISIIPVLEAGKEYQVDNLDPFESNSLDQFKKEVFPEVKTDE